MLLITICVGSSCSLRGSDELASELFSLIEKEKLEGMVDIVGAFCMDACSKGVSVRVGEKEFSGIRPEQAEAFFYKEVVARIDNQLTSHSPEGPAAPTSSGKEGMS
jgi:NADH:ubiquinone oxidoreductase subunit E